ncbi:ferredoxin [Halalkalicoccus tibetensis]|uniref:Ferredoxin n=1 Tax=Halalkalicoccus tibetensis TaxID=175632 RepID=A0ABD5V1I2_9EURY
MRIEYDPETCIGIYQCVDEWEKFEKDMDAGKAELVGAEEEEDGTFVLEVPEGEEFDAEMAARVCPVDAIRLYDDDGEQTVP